MIIQKYENAIEVQQKELKNVYKELQNYRKSNVLNISDSNETKRERELKSELESIKSHIHKLETYFMTQKLHWAVKDYLNY